MKSFFPKHHLTASELTTLPETIFSLFKAWIKVRFLHSGKYMPAPTADVTGILTPKQLADSLRLTKLINGLALRTPFTATCLIKVLAAHKMLQRRKIPHTLHFGVKKNQSGGLEAHSWLSVNKKVLVGGGNLHAFKEISTIAIG